jgi:hypothetical protein
MRPTCESIEEEILMSINENFQKMIVHCFETLDIDLSWQKNSFFQKAILENNIPLINYFIKRGVRADFNNNQAYEIISKHNYIKLLDKFYKLGYTNPADNQNKAIVIAYKSGNFDLAFLLFKYKEVRSTLQNDHEKLYNNLMIQETKNKILSFD